MKSSVSDKEAGKLAYWEGKLTHALWATKANYQLAHQLHPKQWAKQRETIAKVANLVAGGQISEHSVTDALEAVTKTRTNIAKRHAYFHTVLAANLAERGLKLNQLLARTKIDTD